MTENRISSVNSTSKKLAAGEKFTGQWEDCHKYTELRIIYISSHGGDCWLQNSIDGANTHFSLYVPPQVGVDGKYRGLHTLSPISRYYRVVYTNGDTAQTDFHLSFTLCTERGGLVSRKVQTIDRFADVQLARVVNSITTDINHGLVLNEEHAYIDSSNTELTSDWEILTPTGPTFFPFPESPVPVRIAAGGDPEDVFNGTGARVVRVKYLDENWDEQLETILTAGAVQSASTSGSAIRLITAGVKEVGEYYGTTANGANKGDMVFENEDGDRLHFIGADNGACQSSVISVPRGWTYYVIAYDIVVSRNQSANIRFMKRENANITTPPYTSKILLNQFTDIQGNLRSQLVSYIKLPEYTDFWIEAQKESGAGPTQVSCLLEYKKYKN